MAGDWTSGVLADLCDSVDYGYTASAANDPSVGPKFLRITDIRQDGLRWDDVPHVEIPPDKFEKYSLRAGDIVVARTGAFTGANAYVVPPVPAVFASYLVRLTAGPRLDSRFGYYFMQSDAYRDHVAGVLGGSAQPNASAKALTRVEMPVPPLDEQRRIAAVLGALDDKIELNRKLNRTLEEMAQAIFKSWFIDFDGHDDLVDSEIGPVPRGWEVGTLGDLAELNPESWSTRTRPASISYVDLSNTKWGAIEAVTEYQAGDAPSRAQRVLRPGDTIVGTVRPGNGSYALVARSGLTGSTGFAVLRAKAPTSASMIYLAATRRENVDRLAHLADGGAYPAVRPEIVAATPTVVPPASVLGDFAARVDPLLQRMATNRVESRTLADLRDTLLPKLISGELRVPEADAVAEATLESRKDAKAQRRAP